MAEAGVRSRLAAADAAFADREARGTLRFADLLALYREADSLGMDSARVTAAFLAADLVSGAEVEGQSIVALALDAVAHDGYLVPRRRSNVRGILGHLMTELGDHRAASRYFEGAARHILPVEPELAMWPLGNAAKASLRAGDTARALGIITRVRDSLRGGDARLAAARTTIAQLQLAEVAHARRSASAPAAFAALERAFRRVQALHPDTYLSAPVRRALANYALDRGDLARAGEHIDTLALSHPNYARICRARLLHARGRPRAALAEMARVRYGAPADRLEQLPFLIAVHEELGQAVVALAYSEELRGEEVTRRRKMSTNVRALADARLAGIAQESRLAADAAREEVLAAERQLGLGAAVAGLLLVSLLAGFWYVRHRDGGRERARLAAKVDEQTAALQRANARLGARVRELARFNFLLSHDLREPVRSIVSFATLARRHLDHPAALREDLAFVQAGGRQLMDLLGGIEALRLADEVVPAPRVYDAVALVRERLGYWRQRCPALRADLTAETPATLWVETDATILSRVLDVLLENAVRFAGEASPAVTVAVRAREGGAVDVDVRDAGIGFREADAGEVLEAFRRLNRREDYPGAGIGLALARRLLEAVGGDVACVRAAVGLGCTFRVSLPVGTAVVAEGRALDAEAVAELCA